MPRRWNKLWLLVVAERWYRRWIADAARIDGAARAAA
jgi:hypothetical protein